MSGTDIEDDSSGVSIERVDPDQVAPIDSDLKRKRYDMGVRRDLALRMRLGTTLCHFGIANARRERIGSGLPM